MYSLNNWLLVGMMVEWERHGVDQERPARDLGHQDTVSVLPTVEVRPVGFGPLVPYANMSFGVNVNSFGENTSTRISPSNNFAWRLGWGADYMLTKQFALNTEMAYKINDGHATVNGNLRQRLERLVLRLPLRCQTLLLVSEYSRKFSDVEPRPQGVPRHIRWRAESKDFRLEENALFLSALF